MIAPFWLRFDGCEILLFCVFNSNYYCNRQAAWTPQPTLTVDGSKFVDWRNEVPYACIFVQIFLGGGIP